MTDRERLHEFMVNRIPFNQLLGIRIETISPDAVEVQLPERPDLLNHVGTLHAAAQFGLAEATSGTMIASAFGDLIETGFVPLVVEATVKYRRPAQGTLRGSVSLSQDQQSELRTQLAQARRVRIPLSVRVLNVENVVVLELEITWILLKPREESKGKA